MKLLITGGSGQLGSYLSKYFSPKYDVISLTSKDLDITNQDQVADIICGHKPAVIINCAAYTAVDDAESNKDLCMQINYNALKGLVKTAGMIGAKFVQFSTDYVYFGNSSLKALGWREIDETRPCGVYSLSKALGELIVRQSPSALIIRTCGLYGSMHDNFVNIMLKKINSQTEIQVVNDQTCTPTYVPDLAVAVDKLIDYKATGIYHVTNSGYCTWFDFASRIFALIGSDIKVVPITTSHYVTIRYPRVIAQRPGYSVLDCSKYKQISGTALRSWDNALQCCLESYGSHGLLGQ